MQHLLNACLVFIFDTDSACRGLFKELELCFFLLFDIYLVKYL